MDKGAPAPQQWASALPRPLHTIGRLARSERGTAVVEFALVAPLLFAIVLGILNFGRALDYYNQMTQSVGQGARAAAVNCNPDGTCPATANSIQSGLINNTQQPELRSGEHICIMNVPTAVGQPVTVKATFNFSLWPTSIIPIPKPSLTVTSTQRAEAVPPSGVGYTANPADCP